VLTRGTKRSSRSEDRRGRGELADREVGRRGAKLREEDKAENEEEDAKKDEQIMLWKRAK